MRETKRIVLYLGLVALGLGVISAPPASAVIDPGVNGTCVDDITGEDAELQAGAPGNGYQHAGRDNQVPNNCTANDVTFVLVGLGVQDDGCVSRTDDVSIFLRAQVKNTTAQDRYDIGMFVATDGDRDHLTTVRDESGDGAKTGICARQAVNVKGLGDQPGPVGDPSATGLCGVGQACFSPTCPPMDLAGNDDAVADGPYLSGEALANANDTPDWCGGLRDGNNDGCNEVAPLVGSQRWDDTIVDWPDAITFPCIDGVNQIGELIPDGFVDIPTCATWGNQADEVHAVAGNTFQVGAGQGFFEQASDGTNDLCDNELELVPGTKAKCNCSLVNSTIPLADMSATCGGCTVNDAAPNFGNDDGVLDPGETMSCSFTYLNTQAEGCVPSGPPPLGEERFYCGTAGYVRFKVDFDDALTTNGAFSDIVTASETANPANDLVPTPPLAASEIVWTPVSPVVAPFTGQAGIVAPGESETLTFDYTLDLNCTDIDLVEPGIQCLPGIPGTSSPLVRFTMSTFWANVTDFTGEVEQVNSGVGCSTEISATPITLAHFEASRQGGAVRFDWTTATEAGNVGFNIYRVGEKGMTRLNDGLIPSAVVDSTVPREYSFTARGERDGVFVIEDVSIFGKSRQHGPFEIGEAHGARPELEPVDWQELRAEHERKAAKRARDRGRAWQAVAAALPEGAGDPADELRGGGRDGRRTAKASGKPSGSPQAASGGSAAPIHLLVSQTGLYRVTYGQLLTAGFDLAGAKASDLALTDWGDPVPIRVAGGSTFGPGSFIEFWGEAVDTLYTGTAVYQLSVSRANALRVGSGGPAAGGAAAAPFYMETATAGLDSIYSFSAPIDDPWLDTYMLAFTTPASWDFTVQVDGLAPVAATSSVKASLWGVTSWPGGPDHHVIAEFNGAPFADLEFDGVTPALLTGDVGVVEGENTLTVRLPGDTGFDFDMLAYDSVAVTYPRQFLARSDRLSFSAAGDAFEVGGFSSGNFVAYRLGASPSLLAVEAIDDGGSWTARFAGGGSADYAVSTVAALLTPGIEAGRAPIGAPKGKADYLIVSHPDFLDGLAPFVADKEGQGFAVEVVDVEDLYASYSYGNFDPMAIRDFIRDAAKGLGIEYVLLVGGDTYDYRGFGGSGSVSFIPSLYEATGHVVNWAPTDALYADLDDDWVVDLALGRWPVRNTAELGEIIAKTLQYEGKDYGATAVFAADLFDSVGSVSFMAHSERFAQSLGGWSVATAYLDQIPVGTARNALIGSLNNGVALTSYVGHSGPTRWTFSGLFSSGDALALTNAGRPTVVLQWGCWNTYHVEPAFNTLGHAFLLGQDRGAAAVVGSATLSAASSTESLGELLVPGAAVPGQTLGQAIVDAKRRLAAENPDRLDALRDVLLGWTLLGDPSLLIQP